MKKITLLTLFSVFTTLIYGQCPDNPPAFDSDQFFCSASAWALIGEDSDKLGDLQIFPDEIGWTINWYANDNGIPGTAIANPNSEVLVSGAVYHVTQENNVGCESDPLMITLTEKDCACIKDPTFEDQNGNPRARGYQFLEFDGIANHKTCSQSMAGANTITLGAVDGFLAPTDVVVLVTPGNDPPYRNTGGAIIGTIPTVRTNPENPKSSHGLRINRGYEYQTNIAAGQKEFIAGEVISFNFSLVIQDPGHTRVTQPFAQVRIYDSSNSLLVQRCLVSDSNDCIFKQQGNVLYTDWTCMTINTSEWQGEALTIEYVTAYCTPQQHFSYIYIDDIYVGEDYDGLCEDAAFGYALINKVETSGQSCFITQIPTTGDVCEQDLSGVVSGFPLEVCGEFDAPISQQTPPSLNDVTLNIIQNDVVVGTLTNPSAGSGANSFCFTVNDSDISVLPYGDFTFEVNLDFLFDCGAPYSFFVDDRNTFTICPAANCAAPLVVCDADGTGFASFDLNDADASIRGTWDTTELEITYFDNEMDAHDDVNEIPDPTDYTNTTPNNQVVYARLDWNIPGLTLDCYYIAEVELMIRVIPDLVWDTDIIVCGDIATTLIATPSNLVDLGTVTYRWYKDNVQIPHAGSSYNVTQGGDYTVVVSNMGCEITRTITVSKLAFDVDLGDDVEICDTSSSHVINSNIVIDPDSDPIDPNDFTYLWSTGETTENITVTTTGLYWVEVTVGDCTILDQVQVSFRNFDLDLGENVSVCDVTEGYNLFAELTNANLNEVSYLWSTGETTPNITVYNYGTYTVDVNWGTCVQTDQIVITQSVPAEISLGSTVLKCENDEVALTVQFIDSNEGDLIYTWYRDGGMLSDNTQSISVTEFGVYRVEVDNDGCISIAEVLVEGYPSNPDCIITQGISPEGSIGQNDNLNLEFLAIRTGIENLQIFNRNGTMVYERENYVNEWVGQTLDGDSLPTGLYFYVINFSGEDVVHGTQKTGYIYINRGMN